MEVLYQSEQARLPPLVPPSPEIDVPSNPNGRTSQHMSTADSLGDVPQNGESKTYLPAHTPPFMEITPLKSALDRDAEKKYSLQKSDSGMGLASATGSYGSS